MRKLSFVVNICYFALTLSCPSRSIAICRFGNSLKHVLQASDHDALSPRNNTVPLVFCKYIIPKSTLIVKPKNHIKMRLKAVATSELSIKCNTFVILVQQVCRCFVV